MAPLHPAPDARRWDDLALVTRDAKREGDEWDEYIEPDDQSDTPLGGIPVNPPAAGASLARRLSLALVGSAADVTRQAEEVVEETVEEAGELAGDLAAEVTGVRAAEALARASGSAEEKLETARAAEREAHGAGDGEAEQGGGAEAKEEKDEVEQEFAPGEEEALPGAAHPEEAVADDL